MTVFKNYFKIVKKFLPIIIIYTVIFTFFAVWASNTENGTNIFGESKPKVVIINNDEESKLTNIFIEYVKEKAEIIEIETDEKTIKDGLFYREMDYVIDIPKGFSKSFKNGNETQIKTLKVPDSYTSTYAEMLFNRFWNIAKVYMEIGMTEEQIVEIILDDLKEETKISMLDENKNDVERIGYFYNFYNYTIIATEVFVVGMLLNIFNNSNIKRRNIVSPFSYKKINLQLFLANALITFLMWLVYAVIAFILFKEAMCTINGLLILLNSFVFCITVLSIAFLIGILVKNKEAQNGIVNVIALGSSFISGAFVPQELLSDFVLNIAKVIPSYWFVKNNNDITKLSNFDMTSMNPIFINMGIILAFGIGFFILTNLISRLKLKKS